jgi:hypothetical protein
MSGWDAMAKELRRQKDEEEALSAKKTPRSTGGGGDGGWGAMAAELQRQKAEEEAMSGRRSKRIEPDTQSIRSNTTKKPSLWDRIRGRNNSREDLRVPTNPRPISRSSLASRPPTETKKKSLWDDMNFNGEGPGMESTKKKSLWDDMNFNGDGPGTEGPKKKSLWDDMNFNGEGSGMESAKKKSLWDDLDMDSLQNRRSTWGDITKEDLIKLREIKSGSNWNQITKDDISKLRSNWNSITEDDLNRLKELKSRSHWDELSLDDIRKLKELNNSETEYKFQKVPNNIRCGTFISPNMPSVLTNFEPPQLACANFQTPNVNPMTCFEVNEFKRKYPLVHTVIFSTPPIVFRA